MRLEKPIEPVLLWDLPESAILCQMADNIVAALIAANPKKSKNTTVIHQRPESTGENDVGRTFSAVAYHGGGTTEYQRAIKIMVAAIRSFSLPEFIQLTEALDQITWDQGVIANLVVGMQRGIDRKDLKTNSICTGFRNLRASIAADLNKMHVELTGRSMLSVFSYDVCSQYMGWTPLQFWIMAAKMELAKQSPTENDCGQIKIPEITKDKFYRCYLHRMRHAGEMAAQSGVTDFDTLKIYLADRSAASQNSTTLLGRPNERGCA